MIGAGRAAAYVGIHRTSLRRFAHNGTIPHTINSDGELVFRAVDLAAYVKRRQARGPKPRKKRMRVEATVTIQKALLLMDMDEQHADMRAMVRETHLLPKTIRDFFEELATAPTMPLVHKRPKYIRPDGKPTTRPTKAAEPEPGEVAAALTSALSGKTPEPSKKRTKKT